ncbi:MAG: OsmC family protein [Caldilineaceae bacterium]|nr:OsmC family protein [Caldilineaceae bacterium]
MSKTRVKWVEERTFLGIDANGNSAVMSGKDGPGVSPMQMLLLGLGGCSLIDVNMILDRQRTPAAGAEVEIDSFRRSEGDYPRPWETIHMHFIIYGDDLDAKKVERAVQLSIDKYCGAHATLAGTAKITHDFEIRAAREANKRTDG